MLRFLQALGAPLGLALAAAIYLALLWPLVILLNHLETRQRRPSVGAA